MGGETAHKQMIMSIMCLYLDFKPKKKEKKKKKRERVRKIRTLPQFTTN